MTHREADALALVICRALSREEELLKRVSRLKVIAGILDGTLVPQIVTHDKCSGTGKVTVTVESSGGTFYDEEQPCLECSRIGKVQQLEVTDAFWRRST